METLQINKAEALTAYLNADQNGKDLLKKLLGDQFAVNITDRVKSFTDACDVLGIKEHQFLKFATNDSNEIDGIYASINSYAQLVIITKALNEGWEPDWDNEDEYKYYPWFYMSHDGFRLDYVFYSYAFSAVGSRLCFRSRELAEYAVSQFFEQYKQFMIL